MTQQLCEVGNCGSPHFRVDGTEAQNARMTYVTDEEGWSQDSKPGGLNLEPGLFLACKEHWVSKWEWDFKTLRSPTMTACSFFGAEDSQDEYSMCNDGGPVLVVR